MRRCVVFWVVALSTSLLGFASHAKEPVGKGRTPAGNPRRAEPELSERAKDFAEKRERVRAGETVDFWGNGDKYRAWFDEEGVRHVEIRNSEDKIRSTFKTWPNGFKISTYSAYADGIIDRQIERKPGKEIQLYDRNRAGFFNEQLTLITLESRMIHRIHRKRTSATEEWTVIQDSVVPPAHGVPPPELLESLESLKKRQRNTTFDSKKSSHESSHTSSTLPKVSKSAQPLTEEPPANQAPE